MFLGATSGPLRSILHEHVKRWPVQDVYVGCSGAFTIERTLLDTGVRLHSNDVQLFTSALGRYFAGEPVEVRVAEESLPELEWVEPWLDGGEGSAAVVMLGSTFLKAFDNRRNPYYERMLRAAREQFPRMHAKTVERLRSSPLRPLASYTAMDVMEWLDTVVPDGGPVCTFPPFYDGGYETMFAPLDRNLRWEAPTYPELDAARRDALVAKVVDREHWALGLHEKQEHLADHLRGIVQTTNRNVPVYVYTSGGPSRLVRPAQNLEPVLAPRLGPGDVLGERLGLAVLSPGQFATLRSQYLDPKIPPSTNVHLMVAVVVDGVVVGCFAMNPPAFEPTTAYMLSDFAVAPSDYRRLSKLVLHAALSREAQQLMQRHTSSRLTRVATTAFAQNPVSMKYRGVLDLTKRARSKDPAFQWQLQYESDLGRWTLQEGYARWLRYHSQRSSA